jgi:hypothetical protein
LDIKNKKTPVILPTFPPMPQPGNYGIDWQDAELAEALDVSSFRLGVVAASRYIETGEAIARATRFKAQNRMYQQALDLWNKQVAIISEALRTNR